MKKDALIRGISVLAAIVLIYAGLSKLLSHNSQSLAEYASRGASPTGSTVSEKEASSQDAQEKDTTSPAPPVEESAASKDTDTPQDLPASADISAAPSRITYEKDFYYEPLPDNVIASMTGVSFPEEDNSEISYEDLHYVHVLHYDFDGEVQSGELICNKAISQDLMEIFFELYIAEYSIEKIRLIDAYAGDDEASMADNNTSCFNYRPVEGTSKLSKHAYGLAVDINPLYNPYIRYDKSGTPYTAPEGSEPYTDRSQPFPYKIDETDLCYRLFLAHGFTWGGNWNSSKDYQHFQKLPTENSLPQ